MPSTLMDTIKQTYHNILFHIKFQIDTFVMFMFLLIFQINS
jgi:hypothetical protein